MGTEYGASAPAHIRAPAIGKRIRAARLVRGYKRQSEVCERLDIANSNYSRYENGAMLPPWWTIYQISQFFDVPSEWLLEGARGRLPADVRDKLDEQMAAL